MVCSNFGSLDCFVAETVRAWHRYRWKSLAEVEYGFPVTHTKAQITVSLSSGEIAQCRDQTESMCPLIEDDINLKTRRVRR